MVADQPEENAHFLVSARKYRPQTFGELVAQDHVATTLQNAIADDRLAHAYLFCGPRGVGKTSAARILAKAVNCQTPLGERENAEPCRECESCKAFEAGRSLNVIEMDAASNRGIEEAREIRDNVRIPPQGEAKKVYILDEIHMFTKDAFNALLKTLEEPPPYVLFIFATTEPHKVLPTILSRSQRFDFRRISVQEIVGRLREISEAEGISIDEESLILIARRADGALRDAQSLFDQAVALVGKTIESNALREAFGVLDEDTTFAITERCAEHDRAGMLQLVDEILRRGHDLSEVTLSLADHLRNLLVACATGNSDLIEGSDATKKRYLDTSESWSEADLLHLLMLADACASALRTSRRPRLTFELALVKMASLESAARFGSLEATLAKLEERLGGDAPATKTTTAEPGTAYKAKDSQATTSKKQEVEEKSSPSDDPGSDQDDDASDVDESRPGDEPPPSPESDGDDQAPSSPAPATTPDEENTEDGDEDLMTDLFGEPALKTPPESDGGAAAAATLAEPTATASDSFEPIRENWNRIVAGVREARIPLAAMLESSSLSEASNGTAVVEVPSRFAKESLEGSLQTITEAIETAIGGEPPPLRFVVSERDNAETTTDKDPFEQIKRLREDHPVVHALFEQFDATIVY